jgi:hypothetical protein
VLLILALPLSMRRALRLPALQRVELVMRK